MIDCVCGRLTRSVPLMRELVDAGIAAALMRLLADALEVAKTVHTGLDSMEGQITCTAAASLCTMTLRLLPPVKALAADVHRVVSDAEHQLLAAGAVELFVTMWQRFRRDPRKFAMAAVSRLSLSAHGCERALAAGAAKLALESCWTDDAIEGDSDTDYHLFRLTTLRNLAAAAAGRAAVMDSSETLGYIVNMIRVHQDAQPSELLAAACGAIRNLAMSPEHRLPLAEAGAIEVLKAAAVRPSASREVAWSAISALFALACEPANSARLCSVPGASALARAAVEKWPADAGIAWASSGLILKLTAAAATDSELTSIVADGGHGALEMCLQLHPRDERVVRAACAALRRLEA